MKLFPLLPVVVSTCIQAAEPAFKSEKLWELDAAIMAAILHKNCPGGVLHLDHHGAVYSKAYGKRSLAPREENMSQDTIFDIASLTKVVATTPAILKLVDAGKIELHAPVSRYYPAFTGENRDSITIRQLLTHTSGLRSSFKPEEIWNGTAEALAKICREPVAEQGKFLYSDLNFILLGAIVEKVGGKSLDVFCREEIFAPLKMNDTGFLPPASLKSRIAPTARMDADFLRGTVHDPSARRMNGVAGHAGVFSTASDLARFARMIFNNGASESTRVLSTEIVKAMTSAQALPDNIQRGLGWDIQSPFSAPKGKFPPASFGHTGWTGCSIWLDPTSHTFVIFLSNRNHPEDKGNVVELRKTIGTLAAEASGL